MRPGPFAYSRPATLNEALRALATGAVPLAGGQSLLPALRLRQAEPAAIVDLAGVAELSDAITVTPDHIIIGARVTHRALAEHPVLQAEQAWLVTAALALGDVQVRNLGTTLGNLCWADPRANMAVAMLASDAVVTAVAPGRPTQVERIALADFFTGFRTHALTGRLATTIELPRIARARGAYLEFSRQRQDLALVNVCVVRSDQGVRVAVGGIDPRPIRLPMVEAALARNDQATLANLLALSLAPAQHQPIVDQHGSAEYKLELAATLIRRGGRWSPSAC